MQEAMTLEQVLDELRMQGLRITEPRKAIINYLMNSSTHPSIDEIYEALVEDFPKMSLATVYNNINFLVEQGLVYEMKFSQNLSRYDFLGDRHFHIICQSCGKISDFDSSDLSLINQAAEEQTGYLLQQTKVELYGICPDCQQQLSQE